MIIRDFSQYKEPATASLLPATQQNCDSETVQQLSWATFQITPPAPFDFTKPEEWPKWKRRFERFRISSALSVENGDNQGNTLIYAMGDQADDILATFELSEAEEKDYDVVLAKMENYFVAKRNVIFERAKFNKRVQEETETVDSFCHSSVCTVRTLQLWATP